MATPRRSVTKGRWTRGFTVAFLAIAAAVLLTAQPVLANTWELSIDVKDAGKVKKMVIKVDEAKDQVSATVDGKPVKVSDKIPFPVKLGEHSRKIGAIYPGPTIVFEGSSCVYIKGHWIGTPPCP
jgi:hypothetical protein